MAVVVVVDNMVFLFTIISHVGYSSSSSIPYHQIGTRYLVCSSRTSRLLIRVTIFTLYYLYIYIHQLHSTVQSLEFAPLFYKSGVPGVTQLAKLSIDHSRSNSSWRVCNNFVKSRRVCKMPCPRKRKISNWLYFQYNLFYFIISIIDLAIR